MLQFVATGVTLCLLLYLLYLLKKTHAVDRAIYELLKQRIERLEEKVHGRDN